MNEEEQGIISEPDNDKKGNDSNTDSKGSWSIFITIYKKIWDKNMDIIGEIYTGINNITIAPWKFKLDWETNILRVNFPYAINDDEKNKNVFLRINLLNNIIVELLFIYFVKARIFS